MTPQAKTLLLLLSIFCFLNAKSQILNPKNVVKSKASDHVNNDINNGVENGVNKVENGVKNALKKKPKSDSTAKSTSTTPASSAKNETKPSGSKDAVNDFKSFQNYDFVPGDKVLFEDDWLTDETGEFPSHWKLEQGEFIVNKFEGNNVLVAKEQSAKGGSEPWTIMPRMKKEDYLPKEFTAELEVYFLPKKANEGFDDATSHPIAIELFGKSGSENKAANVGISSWREGSCYTLDFTNNFNKAGIEAGKSHLLCVAYKNNQLKVYLDGARLFTIPDVGFDPTRIGLLFSTESADQPTIIKHFRLAEGGNMNLVKKLTTETKFIARGIVFDYNKATIKPESMGELNRIVSFMKEDKNIKFEIGGHTDSDGDDAYNLKLSQQRADAVKVKLVEMGIDAARFTTKGYGETKPINENSTPEGKANNRRVEFVKQ